MLERFPSVSAERIQPLIILRLPRPTEDRPRVPISARLVANLPRSAVADRSNDGSAGGGDSGFFDIPLTTYFGTILIDYQDTPMPNLTVIAPTRVPKELAPNAKRLDRGLALCDTNAKMQSLRSRTLWACPRSNLSGCIRYVFQGIATSAEL